MMAAQNPAHALALVVVDELVRSGVTDAVLAPGSRSAALAMALEDEPRLRLHVEIDERSAGFLAIGLARASGRPAPVVTTSGTATANLHPAVLEADEAAVPLLLLTADRPPELRHRGANQATDQLKLYGDAVRWFVDVGVPEDRPDQPPYWRSTICRAVAETQGLTGPAGPVQVNLAFREPTVPAVDDGRVSAAAPFAADLGGRPAGRPWTAVTRAPRRLGPERRDELARRLAGIEGGLIVAGDSRRPAIAVHRLAEALQWPVIAEPTSGARHGPMALAHATPLLTVATFAAAHRPETVLTVGRPTVSRPVQDLLAAGVPQIHIDADGRWVDPTRTLADLVVADPEAAVADIAAALPRREPTAWVAAWQAADAAAADAVADHLAGLHDLTEVAVARAVADAVPAGGLLTAASSMPIRDLDAWVVPRSDLRVIANRGLAGIDGFVSTTLGAALVHDGPVVALAGDLSLLHDRNGFLLASDTPVDAVFVIVDNDGGGIFHFLPQAAFPATFERVFGTPHGTDFAAVAGAHGLGYHAPGSPAAVTAAVTEAVRAGGLHLVHVRTDRAANVAAHRALQAEVEAAVTRA